MDKIFRTLPRPFSLALAALCLAVNPVRLEGQCTLTSAPVSFEPNPTGPGAPRLGTLSSGFNNHLALFQNANGTRRILMQESYGYSVLDISNPLAPSVLRYHDLRLPAFAANTVAAHGDGQSYVQTIAVSPDGARAAFSLSGPGVPPWNTVVGNSDGGAGFTIWGDFAPNKASGTAIQQVGTRYIAYSIHPFVSPTAIDVTALPGFLDQAGLNMASENTTWPTGNFLTLAGNFLVYMADGNIVQVIDASNPGPPGSITNALPKTALTSADFGGLKPANYAAAVDPQDPNKLWVLVELNAAGCPSLTCTTSPSYALVSLTKGFPAAAVSAGPVFQIPSNPGEKFGNLGGASALIPSNGSLFVLMWASRTAPTSEFRLYSTTASAWGSVPPSSFTTTGFSPSRMSGFGVPGSNAVYAYMATGSAFVLPMSCQAPNSKASASVTNLAANGKPVNSCETGTLAGCTVFIGDTITGAINVVPSGASQPISEFRFDFDFHAGVPIEDNGAAAAFPRLAQPDIDALGGIGGLGASPPASFTLVGPCDPNPSAVPGGTVGTGVGCWHSVMNNTSIGGPDFPAVPAPAPACKQLTFAAEAENQFGSSGAGLASLCWQAPAAKVQSTQILAGGSLVSASDGQPTAYQWSFGPVSGPLVASCTTPSCTPPSAQNVKGTYAYSLAAKYFVDQAFTATATGTFTVTDFVPKFLVNGSATDKITAAVSQPTISITNQSTRGVGVVGTYSYSICSDPCAAFPAFTAWPAMTDSSASATIPNQLLGNWILRIHVTYASGTGSEDWTPNNAGAADPKDFRFTVTNVTPRISFLINGQNPCGGFGVCANPAVGDTITANSTPVDALATWDFGVGATPQTATGQGKTFSYASQGNYTVTVTQSGVSATAALTVNPRSAPPPPPPPPPSFLSVNVSANPNPAAANQTVTFSCNVSGGTPPYTFQWRSPSTSQFVAGTSLTFQTSSPTLTPISAGCTASDSAGASQTNSITVSVVAPPAACTSGDFHINDTASGKPAPAAGLGVIIYTVPTGESLTFVPTGTTTSYLWDFGDGATSTAAQPTHTYTSAGQYFPNVIFDGNATSCKKSYTVQVAGLSGAFTAAYADGSLDVTQVQSGKPVSFIATADDDGSTTFAWDFGDGATATGHNATHVFTAFGANVTYTVTLNVTRGSGDSAQHGSTSPHFTVIPGPDPPKWFVGGMAYLNGAIPGTLWQSDVTILNPHPTLSATYSLAFLAGGAVVDPKDLVYKQITLGPQQSAESTNVLGDFFGLPLGSFGALIVRGDVAPAPPSITSRTFNNGDPTKGSFGLSVPPTQALDGTPPQSTTAPQLLIGLRDDATAYTNVGLVNLISSDWSHAHLAFSDATGAALGVLNVDVPPYGVAQLNRPLTKQQGADGLGLPSSSLYRVQVTVDAGGAVYPYATVIDAISTDPIIVTPTATPASSYLIPGIVRQAGRNGERFRSRVTVSNPSAASRKVRITLGYVLCDGDACGAASTLVGDVNMASGQTQSWDDFVKVWFSVFDHSDVSDTKDYKFSWVDVRPAPGDAVTDPLIVLGETYNETPNGSTTSGRVGFQIPGYTPADGAGTAVAGKRLQLTGLASTANYRTNIALFAIASDTTKWCTAHVYAADGTKLRDIPIQVGAFTSVADATLFGGVSGVGYSILVDSIDDGVTVGGYATIIDNLSGDATFVKAQTAP